MKTASQNQTVSAMSLMVIAMLLIPGMDATAKWLSIQFDISPATIAFARFFVQTIFMVLAIVITTGSFRVKAKRPFFNILRGLLIASASMIFFVAVKYMPIADAISIFFVEPIIVMFLSWMFLGEILGWRRVLAAIVGFFGALLIIQPSFETFGLISLLPLCTAILFSIYLILTRKFGVEENLLSMQFYAGIGGMGLSIVVMFFGGIAGIGDLEFTLPTQFALLAGLFLVGAIATGTHIMIVHAFSIAPASTLAPFQYVEIISATFLGLVIFGDFPNPVKWLGTAIIVLSGLFIFWRERKALR